MKISANNDINAVVCLSNGDYFFGKGIGKENEVFGEICFNTSITGYQEILSDPSYTNQIINFTFPHIGNVGCNLSDVESKTVRCKGLIIRNEITEDSNYRSTGNFNNWLIKNSLTGISGIDTRALTKNIRKKGARIAVIKFVKNGEEINTDELTKKAAQIPDLSGAELAAEVSTKNIIKWNNKTDKSFSLLVNKKANANELTDKEEFNHNYKVAVIDYGVKENIINCLAENGFDIIIFPAKSSYEEIMKYQPDGVLLSNGPGDPSATAKYALPVIKKLIENNIPIFGICLGHQLLALASEAKTEKMFQGHRGANHPVKNLQESYVEITSQNHGFCVSKNNLPDNIEITHISLFDQTIQGIRLKNNPAFSVQYHPESSPGPHDSRYLFKNFINLIKKHKAK